MFDPEAYIQTHIPYRMHSVAWFRHILRKTRAWSKPKAMEVYIDGQLSIRGTHHGITNPSIECGIVHGRVLLEFLGLCSSKGKLAQKKERTEGDIGIERFTRSDGSALSKVTPDEAVSSYPGDKKDAEEALLSLIAHAHKAVAHLTEGPIQDELTLARLDLAASGVLSLTCRYFYDQLGRSHPKYEIPSISTNA